MALLVTRQVTLTEKNDSGPFYNVFYSVDNGNTYSPSPDGQGVYLPSVGSSVNVQVASTTTTIKLVSTGQCVNELPSGSIITTTTSTTAGTTTTTTAPTTTTTTTTTCLVVTAITAWYDEFISADACLKQTPQSQPVTVYVTDTNFATVTQFYNAGGCSSSGIQTGWYAYDNGVTNYAVLIGQNGAVINRTSCGSPATTTTTTSTTSTTSTTTAGTTTTTAPPLILTQVWSDAQPRYGNLSSCGCTGEVGVYNYAILGNYDIYQDLTGKTIYQDNVGDDLFVGDNLWYCITDAENTETTISIRIDNLGEITGWVDCSTTTTTTTTSTTTTTTSATGCYEYLLECLNPGNCQVNYTDCSGDPQSFVQQYDTAGVICARPTPSISGGTVEFLGECELTTTTTTSTSTTTTTTTASPTSMTLYGKTLAGTEFTIIYYKVNFGPNISAFNGNLDSTCSQRALIPNLNAGDIITILTDENEKIEAQAGTSCPSTVGNNTSYTFVLTSGNNNIAFTVDTGATTTTTTSTTSTTTLPSGTNFYATGNYGVSGYQNVRYDVGFQFTGMAKARTLQVGPSSTCLSGCTYSAVATWSDGASGYITVQRIAPDTTADDLGDILISVTAGSATISGNSNPKIFTSGTTINYIWNISNITSDAVFEVDITEG